MKMKIKRKRPYVKIFFTGNGPSIREVVFHSEKPQDPYQPREDGKNALYYIGPFRTNAGAELLKGNPDKYKTVAIAEKAAARIGLDK
jgi:hypothetical protein